MNYEKTKIAIRYRMLGAKYFNALKAMEFASEYHIGKRKDGNPEFSHQVFIANYAVTLNIPEIYLDDLLASIFLHDVCEDYDVLYSKITEKFGEKVSSIVELLSKEYLGEKKTEEKYFSGLLTDPVAVIAKGCDRIHNIQSMSGGFSTEKQISYIEETRNWHLPMLKKARRIYPEFESAIESIKLSLENRIDLIEAIIQEKNPL